mgnify:CR=1 FL=1
MGLLPVIADGVDVSIPTAGLLISAYAIGVMVGAPLMTLAFSRFGKRTALILLMSILLWLLQSFDFSLHMVENEAEKRHGLTLLMQHVEAGAEIEFLPPMLQRVAVYCIEVSEFTGKHREKKGQTA